MRIYFSNIKLPKRAADRFQSLLGDSPINFARDATSFVLGYSDWNELRNYIGKYPETPRDELCTHDELTARRTYQQARLTEFMALRHAGEPPEEIVWIWQPSAAKPQQDAESFLSAPKWRAEGNEFKLLALLKKLERRGSTPSIDEQAFILDGLTNSSPVISEVFTTYTGPLAAWMVNDGDDAAQGVGMRFLERMIPSGDMYARVSLAKALVRGKGGKVDLKRAMDLLNSVIDPKFLHPNSYIELYTLIAELCLKKGTHFYEPTRALHMLEQAAAHGDGESAWYAALFYDDVPVEDWGGHVPPDPVKALELYRLALRQGVRRSIAFMSELLARHPHLGSVK